jgi:hypothetical protein
MGLDVRIRIHGLLALILLVLVLVARDPFALHRERSFALQVSGLRNREQRFCRFVLIAAAPSCKGRVIQACGASLFQRRRNQCNGDSSSFCFTYAQLWCPRQPSRIALFAL